MYISNDKNWIKFLQHMYKHSAQTAKKPAPKKKEKPDEKQLKMFNE